MSDKILTVNQRRRKSYSVLEKRNAILWYTQNQNTTTKVSYSDVFIKYGVDPGMFTKWMKNKDKILNEQAEVRRIGSGSKQFFPELEDYLHSYIKTRADKGIKTNGPMIKQLALDYISVHGTEEQKATFKASNGWLDGFLKRNSKPKFQVPLKESNGNNCGTDSIEQ